MEKKNFIYRKCVASEVKVVAVSNLRTQHNNYRKHKEF